MTTYYNNAQAIFDAQNRAVAEHVIGAAERLFASPEGSRISKEELAVFCYLQLLATFSREASYYWVKEYFPNTSGKLDQLINSNKSNVQL